MQDSVQTLYQKGYQVIIDCNVVFCSGARRFTMALFADAVAHFELTIWHGTSILSVVV